MKTMHLIALILLALATACTRATSPDTPTQDKLEMRVYNPPEGMGDSLRGTLNNYFTMQVDGAQTQLARITTLPNGSLMLLATEEIHTGFGALIEDLQTHKPPRPANAQLKLWLVVGTKNHKGEVPTYTNEGLLKGMEAIRKSDGEMDFFLVDKISNTGALGQRLGVRSLFLELGAEINRTQGQIFMWMEVESRHLGDVRTRLHYRPDTVVILSEGVLTNSDLEHLVSVERLPKGITSGSYYYILDVQID